ncbi:hypothetical protein NT6N_02420 [Oceaniferula spumae]|uniref:PPM-type phosphatase domain-containing protein n=1 Tax=Oceaniferula spumae TaxID=2979115 RepID=A0AAT9FGV3_9BACT
MKPKNPFLPGAGPIEPDHAPATIEWSARSQSGSRKPVNDDSWLAFASDLNGADLLEPEGVQSLHDHDLIFAVSDGMGGGNAGDQASKLLLETLSTIIPDTFKTAAAGMHPDYFGHMEKAIAQVHDAINASAEEDEAKKGMAATLALAWFTPENLYLVNVGDSRIYLHREQNENSETRMLTLDHTFAWRKFHRGEINERQFRSHPRRSALYQVVGSGRQAVTPYVAAFSYQPGDRFLICSDGLIDGLWEKHIHSAFSTNLDSTSSLADSLMTRAITNDGSDDTTLITLAVHETAE